MRVIKFKTLAVAAVLVAAGVAVTDNKDFDAQSSRVAKQASIGQKEVNEFFKGVWAETKNIASNANEKTKHITAPIAPAVKNTVALVGKRLENSKNLIAHEFGVNDKSEKNNALEKKLANDKKHKEAKKKKVKQEEIELQQENTVNAELIAKKDKTIKGVINYLEKLRSKPKEDNKNKPKNN